MTIIPPRDNSEAMQDFFSQWTTMKHAAHIVGRDHSTIRFWADRGRITVYYLGVDGKRVVNIEEVKAYSEQANRLDMTKRTQNRRKKLDKTQK